MVFHSITYTKAHPDKDNNKQFNTETKTEEKGKLQNNNIKEYLHKHHTAEQRGIR